MTLTERPESDADDAEDADRASDHQPDQRSHRYAHIPGWGADLDPANRPAYPMERTPPRLPGLRAGPLLQQLQQVQVLHSTERSGITPLFGSSVPPSGVSGRLRELAFRYSENDLRHWLILLFADRVNMFEGLGEDLRQGHIPNIYAEMGGAAEWRYNRAGVLRKALVAAAVVGLTAYVVSQRRGRAQR